MDTMRESRTAPMVAMMNADAASSRAIETAIDLAKAGRLDEAEILARRRLAADPADPDALNLLGGIARARGDREGAVRHFAEALRAEPQHSKAEGNLGATLLELGCRDDALRHLRAAVARDATAHDVRVNLGTALVETGDYEAAEMELRTALAAAPDDALAWNSLGNALFHRGQVDAAIDAFETSLRHDGTLAMAWNNLGSAWREKGDAVKAEEAFRHAIAIRAEFPAAWTGLGVALREQGRFAEGHAAHDRALTIDPGFASARFNRAVIDLGEGRFADGFRDYRARPLDVRDGMERESLPDDLSGRRVLLLPNQGLGDELFFLRFARRLRNRGARLIYRAGAPIASIVTRAQILDDVLTGDDPDPPHDLAISIGDLPYLESVSAVADIPPPLSLAVSAEQRAAMAARLSDLGPPPYVGLTWRAGTREWNALLKEIAPETFGAALRGVRATFVVLQRAPDEGEVTALSHALGARAHDLSALNRDLEAMLALLHTIELYVGVSNTNTHLRAGTGRPSHVLVPHPPEWRWMHTGDRSPWFPTFPLYRQERAGSGRSGWENALSALRRDILAGLPEG
ncbi:MAG: tetratricopeptide repeat protein [Gemmatimonas sp.]